MAEEGEAAYRLRGFWRSSTEMDCDDGCRRKSVGILWLDVVMAVVGSHIDEEVLFG